ncbi:tumor necrosis factor receptor superfamily member 6 isoform X1 [Erinaceus europaeus]|uniref:Tumor necrosis factor receptor superfamily member 6 n=1 Tax=Erinaceus europaeus TaxID=9365 RepID=A0ABM3WZU6_ERIEU|nr:tumor necrosis factor receptor superfamily member 6 isoform X1 [Erinaceus europaeus]
MPGVWVLRASILAAIAGPLLDGHKAKVTGSSPAKAEPGAKNVTKRSSECLEDPALWGELCCLPCLPGERKVSDCTSYRNRSGCEPCLAGKEYTELRHHALQCRKCRTCDGEHGLEVHRSCVPTQNTKCRCKPNFFCDTSDCEHCTPCSRCEHGIAEDCTPTSNTKCKEGSRAGLWGLLFLLVPIPIVGLLWWRKRRRQSSDFHGVSVPSDMEMLQPDTTNLDLNKYIPTIAEQMTITEVKDFVRKNGISETKIDEVKNDHVKETAEQKVQLLRIWYQSHGKKDAYNTMMKSLRKINRVLAERIQDRIQTDTVNEQENANF